MAEPTISEQILTALSSVYASLAEISGRLGTGLLNHFDTNGYEIRGAALDEDDYAPPMVMRAYADMDLYSATGTRVHNALSPDLAFYDPPSSGTITSALNGAHIAFDGSLALALVLDADIPTPDGAQRWVCMLHNEGTANIGLTAAGGLTLNGATDEIEIEPGQSRLISRKDDGFRVQ